MLKICVVLLFFSIIHPIKDNILITGGEAGIVTVWDTRLPEISEKSDSNKLKEKIKTKDSRKSKPY